MDTLAAINLRSTAVTFVLPLVVCVAYTLGINYIYYNLLLSCGV